MLTGVLILTLAAAHSPHFRVVGPAESAPAAAVSLERLHGWLTALGFATPAGSTEVVLFENALDMTPYAPGGRASGFFAQGTDSSFLAVALDSGEPLRALSHEFVHRVLQPRLTGRPEWLREGLAELLSNLEAVPGGLRLGTPIRTHLSKQPDPFYATSWAAAHRLLVGQNSALALSQRIDALPERLEFSPRLQDPFSAELLPVAPAADPEIGVRALEPWERDHQRAELLRARNQTAPARAALIVLRSRFPDRPEPLESLGALDMDAFRYDDAERRLAEAMRLGSRSASAHYRYSLLLLRPERPAEQAALHARRAVELDRAQPLHWLAQAQAEMQLARWDAARASLDELSRHPQFGEQVAIERAELERRREQSLRPPPTPQPPARITFEPMRPPEAAPPPQPKPKPRPTSPWTPGTLLFWGWVRGVECTSEGKILTVTNPRFTVRVRERPDRPARLYSPPKNVRRLPCTLKNVEVNVIYRPLGGFGPLNGDLVAVLF
jgi:tetratricopeptide (TPR) repeat protein